MRCLPWSRWVRSSKRVGDRQRLRRVEPNHLRSARREDHFLLDPRRRDAIARRAVGLDGEHHAGLELDRLLQRAQTRDELPLVQAEAEAMAEVEAEGVHLARDADLLGSRE